MSPARPDRALQKHFVTCCSHHGALTALHSRAHDSGQRMPSKPARPRLRFQVMEMPLSLRCQNVPNTLSIGMWNALLKGKGDKGSGAAAAPSAPDSVPRDRAATFPETECPHSQRHSTHILGDTAPTFLALSRGVQHLPQNLTQHLSQHPHWHRATGAPLKHRKRP